MGNALSLQPRSHLPLLLGFLCGLVCFLGSFGAVKPSVYLNLRPVWIIVRLLFDGYELSVVMTLRQVNKETK